jgi:hypothetical protein
VAVLPPRSVPHTTEVQKQNPCALASPIAANEFAAHGLTSTMGATAQSQLAGTEARLDRLSTSGSTSPCP